jgi:hypothetical protein
LTNLYCLDGDDSSLTEDEKEKIKQSLGPNWRTILLEKKVKQTQVQDEQIPAICESSELS